MDIANLINEYLANDTAKDLPGAGAIVGAVSCLLAGMVIFFLLGSHLSQRSDPQPTENSGGMSSLELLLMMIPMSMLLVGFLVGHGVGKSMAEDRIGSSWEDYQSRTLSGLADDVESNYEVMLSDDHFSDAFTAAMESGDGAVIPFSGEHEGQRKSLGLQVDKQAGELTLYEGDTALKPVR